MLRSTGLVAVMVIAVALAGCSGAQLRQFTLDDLAAAGQIASRHGDEAGVRCADALAAGLMARSLVAELDAKDLKGFGSAYELARVYRREPILDEPARAACAEPAVDLLEFLVQQGIVTLAPAARLLPGFGAMR